MSRSDLSRGADWGQTPQNRDEELAVLPRRPNAWAMQELDPTLENRVEDVMRLVHERDGEARFVRSRIDTLRSAAAVTMPVDAEATIEMKGPPAALLEALAARPATPPRTDDRTNKRPSDGSMLAAAPRVPPAPMHFVPRTAESTMEFRVRAGRGRSPLFILVAVLFGIAAGVVLLGTLAFLLPGTTRRWHFRTPHASSLTDPTNVETPSKP